MEVLKSNYEAIMGLIKDHTPPSRKSPDYDCVGTTGCDSNTILKLNRNGEFYQFTVKVLQPIKPLITDAIIIKTIDLILVEEYDSAIRLLQLKEEFISHGYEVLLYLIVKWFRLCKIDFEPFKKLTWNFYLNNLESRLLLVRSDTILEPVEITDVGANVVPSSWLGKIFKSGKELHQAIDTLDWRRGKPPTTYCCIYSMTKMQKDNIILTKNLSKDKHLNSIIVNINSEQIATFINFESINKTHCVEYLSENSPNMVICFNPLDHFISDDKIADLKLKKYSVGLLSSTLQKCIRHGSCSTGIVIDTINKLARARPYNLPEQQYLKVSGSRQLFWRLFITCIEDFRYYYDSNFKILNLFDILALAFICNKEPDYVINDKLLTKLIELTSLITKADDPSDYHEWRNYKESKPEFNESNTLHQNIIYLSHQYMPKMSGDGIMIKKYFDMLGGKYKPVDIKPNQTNVQCLKCSNGFTPKYTGVDIHCYPNMILKLQSILRSKLSTQQISSLVWELNSKFNNRKPNEITNQMINSIYVKKMFYIQKEYWGEYINLFDIVDFSSNEQKVLNSKEINQQNKINQIKLTNYEKRILFLKIFGKKIRIPVLKSGEKVLEVIFSYQDWVDSNSPIQIKYVNSEEYLKAEDYSNNIKRVYSWLKDHKQPVKIEECDCVLGWKWLLDDYIKIGLNDMGKPVVESNKNQITLEWFDGSKLVETNNQAEYIEPNIKDYLIIKNMLGIYDELNLMDCNCECRKKKLEEKLIDLKQFKSHINVDIVKGVLVKIQTAYDNIITISQVTRMGDKMDESVDYIYEGKYLSMLNLINYCYPNTLIPKGELKFLANKSNPSFYSMLRDLNYLIENTEINKNIKYAKVEMKTKLWNHQKTTVNFIIQNINEGKKGFGDASNVGAGKTLTALATCVELFNKSNSTNKFLVLLPTEKLYKTWIDEINKHFVNLNYITQNADGSLVNTYNDNMANIYITTMGRNREHGIKEDWAFVIVDECLTVQNKEAIQTMEAWKQVINSKFGVLLLSATFFRTRFDKLLYMLKMLDTGLPENKEYLDTILYDSIKVNLPLTKRTWAETLLKEKPDKKFMENYNKINQMDISNELKYSSLEKLIRDEVNYIEIFNKYIKQLTKTDPNVKILIYATSKKEAEKISELENVGLYPDISKTHVVVSYANGTYGLNDLVGFNHILSRPPEPDKLPQMKGRLDRPGQKSNDLAISYIILADTIEEAHYLRLEICNKFYSNHIMPLSDFYSMAVNTGSIKEQSKLCLDSTTNLRFVEQAQLEFDL